MNNNLEFEQPQIYKTIGNMIERAQLPHALIFCGDKSVSKLDMAISLTKRLYEFTFKDSDNLVSILKRIDDNSFTNLFIIEPEKGNIKKEVVKDIIKESIKTSMEDGPKVFIFNGAESLNVSSSNSLLKFIEEPIDDTYIIFIVDNIESLLPTIRSRCVTLFFKPLNKELLIEKLVSDGHEKGIVLPLIEYSLDSNEVEKIIGDEKLISILSLVEELFMVRIEDKESMITYLNERRDVLEDSQKNKELSDYKKNIFISLIIALINDLIKLKNNDENIAFIMIKERLNELKDIYTLENLIILMEEAMNIKIRLKYNINFRLNIDKLLMDIELKRIRG